jgi:hypothetical protein
MLNFKKGSTPENHQQAPTNDQQAPTVSVPDPGGKEEGQIGKTARSESS